MSDKRLRRLEHSYTRQDFNDQNAGLVQFTSTPEGRKALWWLLGECGTFDNPFNPDPYITAYASGMQAIGQLLIERMGVAAPDAFVRATQENQNERTSRDAARNAARDRTDDGGYEPDRSLDNGDPAE